MIQPTLLEKLQALPESLQTQVSQYIDLLLEKHLKNTSQNLDTPQQELQQLTETEAEKRYGYGSMAGQIIMADDFDDPLEDLAEYM